MNIFVPFKLLRAETWLAMSGGVVFVPLVEDFDYWRYLQTRWVLEKTFVNVEQDVIPTWKQIYELLNCPNPWCGFGYKDDTEPRAYLGCTKITDKLIKALPKVWNEKVNWALCDSRLATKAMAGGNTYCHHGVVEHLESCNPFLEHDSKVAEEALDNLKHKIGKMESI